MANAYTFDYIIHSFYGTARESCYYCEADDDSAAAQLVESYLRENYDQPVTLIGVETVKGADHDYESMDVFFDLAAENTV